VIDDSYLFEEYEPWQMVLKKFHELRPAEARAMFKEFLTVRDVRVSWWLRTARRAALSWPDSSDEFIVSGWRLIKDGVADEIAKGRSGGMWVALAVDWSIHASETLRVRYDLKWKLSTRRNTNVSNYPVLYGFRFAHPTYEVSLHSEALAHVFAEDKAPPFPIRLMETLAQGATDLGQDLTVLSSLGTTPVNRKYRLD
jgi:hypothetical protein